MDSFNVVGPGVGRRRVFDEDAQVVAEVFELVTDE